MMDYQPKSEGVASVGKQRAHIPDFAIDVILIILSRTPTEIDFTITPTFAVKTEKLQTCFLCLWKLQNSVHLIQCSLLGINGI